MVGNYKRGLWTEEEDKILMDYIRVHGKGRWSHIPKVTGLKRCGKSCRLRWINYLNPNVKRDDFPEEEDDLIIRLHNLLGNRWSLISGRIPGRTDNQVKNRWNSHLSRKLGIKMGKKKVGVTPLKHLREAGETLCSVPIDSSSKLTTCRNNGGTIRPQVINVGLDQTVNEASDVQEDSMPSECNGSSFWIFNDDLDLQIPSLMELLDGFPLDQVWHGL